MVDSTARAMFVGGFEENRAAGSKSAVLISIADPRGAWTDADLDFDQLLTTARPPGADPGLVSFRPPIGKNDQPWPGPSPTVRGHDILPIGGHRNSPRAAANSPHGRPRISPPVLS